MDYRVLRLAYVCYRRIARHSVRLLKPVGRPLVVLLMLASMWPLFVGFRVPSIWLLTSAILLFSVLIQKIYGFFRLSRLAKLAQTLTSSTSAATGMSAFTSIDDLGLKDKVREAVCAAPLDEIVLARLDQDGRTLGIFGPLPFLPEVREEEYFERRRNRIDIVVRDGRVLVRKNYRKDRAAFYREWYNLSRLQGKASIPSIWKADRETCVLYTHFILGRTVREILVSHGARIRDTQTRDDPELENLTEEDRTAAIAARGTALVPTCLSEDFLVSLERQIRAVHAVGVAGLDVKFGNVIISAIDGSPWLVDFEDATFFSSPRNILLLLKRDNDLRTFSRLYGRHLVDGTVDSRAVREP